MFSKSPSLGHFFWFTPSCSSSQLDGDNLIKQSTFFSKWLMMTKRGKAASSGQNYIPQQCFNRVPVMIRPRRNSEILVLLQTVTVDWHIICESGCYAWYKSNIAVFELRVNGVHNWIKSTSRWCWLVDFPFSLVAAQSKTHNIHPKSPGKRRQTLLTKFPL